MARRSLWLLASAGCLSVALASCRRESDAGAHRGLADGAAAAVVAQDLGGLSQHAQLKPCEPSAMSLCYTDTAYAHEDPGAMPIRDKWWIWFGARGDSIEFDLAPGDAIWTSIGEDRAPSHDNVPNFRRRLARDGAVEVWVLLPDTLGDTVAYTLRVRRISSGGSAVLRPTGERATLTIQSHSAKDRFAVVPLAVARSVRDLSSWQVHPETYNVALVQDSLYELCRLPCVRLDTVKLTPSARVTKSY